MNQKSPWSEVYAWFWINEQEIINHTQEEFEKRVQKIRDDGATIIIDFSLTHYRMSFVPYMDKIHDSIRKLAAACHKFGLKLVEHHSASLVFDLFWSEGWKRLEADIGSFSDWKSDVYSWIEVPRYLIGEPKFYGKDLRSMFQIDGRTGEKAESCYDSDCFCYNNPDYRAMYFQYMTDLIKTGIDGIMNDDVQYFADGNACTCSHCRKLFHENYGYELPEPKDWAAFYGDYDNPAFVAWERFKRESTCRFYHDLSDLYDSLGVSLIRPNYVSAALESNWTSYGFDTCCDIWDNIYQENCFSTVIKASYLDYMIEAVHRFAAAERRGVATMSQFYPGRADTVYFAWALSRAWGQLYTGTCEGVNITHLERKYREFEKAHEGFYDMPKKMRDISFYFSMQTRDYTRDAKERYMRPFMAGLQASAVAGLGTDMVFEQDTLEQWAERECIVASHVAMLTDAEILRFKQYVQNGGKLIILGDFATFDETNQPRSIERVIELLGVDVKLTPKAYQGAAEITYKGKNLKLDRIQTEYSFDEAFLKSCTLGKGELIWAPFTMDAMEYQPSVWADRRQEKPLPEHAYPSRMETQKKNTGALLRLLVGEPKMQVHCTQNELYASYFAARDGLAIHLVNLQDTIPHDDRLIGHEELIQNFTENGQMVPEIEVSIQLPQGIEIQTAHAYTPDQSRNMQLDVSKNEQRIHLSLPADFFTGYALITLN